MCDWLGAAGNAAASPIRKGIGLDADSIGRFKDRAPNGQSYRTGINAALREYAAQHDRK